MYKAKYLFFISLLCLVLSSSKCRKDCKDKPRQVFLPQEVLDYVDFKTGTYWVYKDSATGRIDSEVVISSRHFMEDVGGLNECGSRHYENIEMVMKRYDSLVFIVQQGSSFLLGYPFSIAYDNHGYNVKEFLSDSIIYNNVKYYHVLTQDGQFGNQNYFTYAVFAKKIGRLYFGTTGGNPNDFQKANIIRYKIM